MHSCETSAELDIKEPEMLMSACRSRSDSRFSCWAMWLDRFCWSGPRLTLKSKLCLQGQQRLSSDTDSA